MAHIHRFVATLTAAAMFALWTTGAAHASITTFYDNFNAPTSDSDSVSSFGPLADSFSTGSSAAALIEVDLLLSGDNTIKGSTTVSLLSDNSASPGALITVLATIPNSVLTSS